MFISLSPDEVIKSPIGKEFPTAEEKMSVLI
jgi:hypothetical protein